MLLYIIIVNLWKLYTVMRVQPTKTFNEQEEYSWHLAGITPVAS